jgi:pimeloyl-ACP methyl ester carboxylesterase
MRTTTFNTAPLAAPPSWGVPTVLAEVGAVVTSAAEKLHVPFAGDARAVVRRGEIRRHPIWVEPPVQTDGLPVVLVGGLLTATPVLLGMMREWLTRLGCRVVIAPTGFGVGCGEDGAQIVAAAARDLGAAAGEPPAVIAYSRGGQFARAAAVRHPELFRTLVTLGSPLADLTGVHPLLRLQIYALGAAGTLGVPGLLRASCLWGSCCRRLRYEIAGPFPADVPFLSIYSRTDEMVYWRSSLDPAARHHEVWTSHGGLVADAAVFTAVAAELGAARTGSTGDRRGAATAA